MTKKISSNKKGENLRKLAEKILSEKEDKIKEMPVHDIKKLIHELQVHQIELEMQNEELRKAQVEIEESRSKYADLYDFAPIGYLTLNKDGMIVEANLTFCSLVGVARMHLLNYPFSQYVKGGFKARFHEYLQKVLESDYKQRCDLMLIKKDGTPFHISMESIAVKDMNGDLLCRSAVIDTTDLKKAEESLRINEKRYRILFNSLPQRIFYKNKDLLYVSCNKSLAGDLHIEQAGINGKTDYDLYPEELAARYRTKDRNVLQSGQTEETDEEYFKDGQEFTIHTVRTPVRDEDGNVIGILGVFWDITEKVALEREAERSRHLASLGEIAAGIGHEINNPINGLINCAQILLNKSREESREKDLARRIIKEGDRIAAIVGSLLSFTRLEDKNQKNSVCIHDIIKETLILSEAQLRRDGIELRLDIPNNMPKIFANAQLIQQVFLNIINNARYALNQAYSEAHDNKILEITGEVITVDNSPYVKIAFTDHGTGIPASVKNRVMNPFFTTKPAGKGTGLGLSISHNIVSDHGGKLVIDSKEGIFTRISVLFPIRRVTDRNK